jgi:hypothetical protein
MPNKAGEYRLASARNQDSLETSGRRGGERASTQKEVPRRF